MNRTSYFGAIDHVLQHCGTLKSSEAVLILCNPQTRDMADAFLERAQRCTEKAELIELPFLANHGQEPSEAAASRMLDCELTISLCVFSLAHSLARKRAAASGGRFLSLPMYTWELLGDPAVSVEFDQHRGTVKAVAERLSAADSAVVTSVAGTHLTLDLAGRRGNEACGVVRTAGDLGSPPDIEANIAPCESRTEGRIVVDGSITAEGLGLLSTPVTLHVRAGKVHAFECAEQGIVDQLEAIFGDLDSPRRVVAELGIGLNPAATLTGVMLTDEGALGCVHFGLGSNDTIGGENRAGFHLDFVIRQPSLSLDGILLINSGTILL